MLLAIDIGGTKIAAARVENSVIVERRQCPMAYEEAGFRLAIESLLQAWPAPDSVAVATTGYIDAGRVRSVNLDIIPFWDGFALGDMLRSLFDCPVALINDGQAAAWGEYLVRQQDRPQDGPANLLFITLSTGVGGGMVLDGQLRLGPHGVAGHVGHAGVRLAPADHQNCCGCGRKGCLEMVASGSALARQATAIYGRALNSAELFAMAAQGDAKAEAIIANAACAVAEAIAGFYMILDLSEVVIGGSVGLAEGMLDRIQRALAQLPVRNSPKLTAARLGGDAGLAGVVAWAKEQP
ncbi:ROK family protein [Roseateles oligotrophus]|uniref:ROK family protein n=1 Tax=Roseateles oligotrophus TaxID=1769250 RepID=A0ABT2YK13_9BURK|nr:ROK family protein [Roseateles oligotrophus]MCV2370398.1 ROK family protein [Roseateles oligotrophus]